MVRKSVPFFCSVDEPLSKQDCKLCHIPYSEVSVPFQAQLIKCAMCR